MHTFHHRLATAWQRFIGRLQAQRRLRRDLRQLEHMSAYELRDIGLSHAAVARAATTAVCCR